MKLNEEFYLSDEEKNEALGDKKELSDDFLFNAKNFNTIILEKKEKEAEQSIKILDVEKFIEQYDNVSEKNDLLLWLKQNNYKTLLADQIQEIKDENILSKLICAYWEAGFNDSKDLLLFIPHLLSSNFSLALEAHSAIIGLARPFDENDVQQSVEQIEQVYDSLSEDTLFLVDEVLEMLKSELNTNSN
ncbi:MAG: hypothetical protein KatS3mg027_1635 [Bacteroidia bacterium]|nr:MAG: hypothetical protein KatS3mg027_1635 [Bacteroidia bacterium]